MNEERKERRKQQRKMEKEKKVAKEKRREQLRRCSGILFGAAGLCFLMILVSLGSGKEVYQGTLSSNNPVAISLTKVGKTHKIEARPIGKPSVTGYDIEVALLDANRKYLFSFGDSFWYEEGRDSEGPWSEGHTKSALLFVLREAGEHYLQTSSLRPIKVKVIEGVMLARYFIILMIALLAVASLIWSFLDKGKPSVDT